MTDERKLKYLGINLTKDMRFFCDEKYKTLSNTIEKNTENEKKIPYSWVGTIIIKMFILQKAPLQIHCKHNKTTTFFSDLV